MGYHGGVPISDQSEKLEMLLDGQLGPEILEKDPILAKLAERIYGEDFLETMGLSRGESKRALSETLSDDLEDDMLIEIIPTLDMDLEPFDPPTLPEPTIKKSSHKSLLLMGGGLLLMCILNLLGLLSFLGSSCSGGGCPANGNNKINWASIGNLDTGWGWSPSLLEGVIGIPDIILLIASVIILGYWYFKR
ncbi:MAG: hypothetical protein QF807_01125 [Candidatus Thalassarchaeaceae archaeon]|nr:hypothetical protein [Candidatus Thalassarchaeaceae archaeon]